MTVLDQLLHRLENIEIEQEIQSRASKRLSRMDFEAQRLEQLLTYIDFYRTKKAQKDYSHFLPDYQPSERQLSETERLEAELRNMEIHIEDMQANETTASMAETVNTDPADSSSEPIPSLAEELAALEQALESTTQSPTNQHAVIPPLSDVLPTPIAQPQTPKQHATQAVKPRTKVTQISAKSKAAPAQDVLDAATLARVEHELDEELYASADYFEQRYLDEIKEIADALGIRKNLIEQRAKQQSNGKQATQQTTAQFPNTMTKTTTGFVVCLMFQHKKPVEWSEEGSGGWRESGLGHCYTELSQAKQQLKKLKARWPDYPLKIIKRD